MTLIIAWKNGSSISFASDSRLTFSTSICKNGELKKRIDYVDVGIKIFSIPVEIQSPVQSETGRNTIDYKQNIGLCVAGNTTNAYVVKEAITEVLQHLQHTPYTDFSMVGICNLVVKFYEHTSIKLGEILREEGLFTFFIGGFCPLEKRVRVFKFYIDQSDHPLSGKFEEIFTVKQIEFLGSGASKAEGIYSANRLINIFKLVKEVINDDLTPSVGGNIQYGSFDENNNFKVFGVVDYDTDEHGMIRNKFLLRGTQLYDEDIKLDESNFHISFSFIDPFQKDVFDKFKKELP